MAERIRVRCPICGSMPTLPQLENTAKKWPAKLMLYLQKFGGKAPVVAHEGIPTPGKKKGSAPGYMEYIDITETSAGELARLKPWFDRRVAEYLEGGK